MEWSVRQGVVELGGPVRREPARSRQGSGEAAIDRLGLVVRLIWFFLVLDLIGLLSVEWAAAERDRVWGNLWRTEDTALVVEEVAGVGNELRRYGEIVVVVVTLRLGM